MFSPPGHTPRTRSHTKWEESLFPLPARLAQTYRGSPRGGPAHTLRDGHRHGSFSPCQATALGLLNVAERQRDTQGLRLLELP